MLNVGWHGWCFLARFCNCCISSWLPRTPEHTYTQQTHNCRCPLCIGQTRPTHCLTCLCLCCRRPAGGRRTAALAGRASRSPSASHETRACEHTRRRAALRSTPSTPGSVGPPPAHRSTYLPSGGGMPPRLGSHTARCVIRQPRLTSCGLHGLHGVRAPPAPLRHSTQPRWPELAPPPAVTPPSSTHRVIVVSHSCLHTPSSGPAAHPTAVGCPVHPSIPRHRRSKNGQCTRMESVFQCLSDA